MLPLICVFIVISVRAVRAVPAVHAVRALPGWIGNGDSAHGACVEATFGRLWHFVGYWFLSKQVF